MIHFQIFDKIDSFLKNISNVLDSKKARLHLWIIAWFTKYCWLAFFLFLSLSLTKIEPSWRNCLIWTVDWGGEHNTADTENALIIFLTDVNFCFISDCGNSFNWKLKKLTNEQIIIFYNPSNALGSFEESVQIMYLKHHDLTGMCFLSTWVNQQILHLC